MNLSQFCLPFRCVETLDHAAHRNDAAFWKLSSKPTCRLFSGLKARPRARVQFFVQSSLGRDSFSLQEAAEAASGCIVTPLQSDSIRCQRVITDTRELRPGDVFVCLKGESFDGHAFVSAAVEKGAVAVVTDHSVIWHAGQQCPEIRVSNTLRAYQNLGRWWRRQFSAAVVGVTGSVGKTTTKELISSVLETLSSAAVLKSRANFNNEIGVPKTLLEMNTTHRFAVVEMGMRGRGEIMEVASIAEPQVGVITNVGTAHIGRLGSRKAIAEAKCELLEGMRAGPHSETAVAILNADNELLMETAAAVWPVHDPAKTITYGLERGRLRGELTTEGCLLVDGVCLPVPLPGAHNASNFLAAVAVARALSLPWTRLAAAQMTVDVGDGRCRQQRLAGGVVLLDETYNAGPESMAAALKLLAKHRDQGGRRIAVLGRMGELGSHSVELHTSVGRVVRECALDELFLLVPARDDPTDEYGVSFEHEAAALEAAAAPVPCTRFTSHDALAQHLIRTVAAHDTLLFKASHAVGLSKVVAAFVSGVSSTDGSAQAS